MKRKVEFIESYIKSDGGYQWNDNHGELIRCKDCEHLKVSGELEHTNGDTTFYYICDYWHRATDEGRYCDEGARRKGNDNDNQERNNNHQP